jgi:anti-sigma B factor antagonist
MLTMERRQDGARVLLSLGGVASLRTSRELKETLTRDSLRSEVRQVVLEMSGIEMLDSSVLGILLEAQQRLVRRGGELIIMTPSEEMNDLLVMTDLEQLIPVIRSAQDLVPLD